MADNRVASAAVGTGPTFALAELTSFSGDSSVVLPLDATGILSGSEGSWTFTLYTGGAGAVTAGTQRITLASDDPAVAALGAVADAAATQGSTGSVSAKLRTVTSQLNTGNTSLASIDGKVTACDTGSVTIAAALPAGTNNIGDVDVLTIAAGDNNIGNVDIVTVPSDPFGANADAASATGSISAKLRFIASTGIPITGTVTVGSHAVTNTGTFVVQVDGTALTRLTDIETNTDSGAVVGNGAAATAQRVTLANDSTGIVALTTSTASIGKLASNTGVTIGAVEIAAAQTLATVTTVSTVTTCSTVTTVSTLTGSGIAHDGVDSGNPHKIGAKATTSLSAKTMVANDDRSDLFCGTDGVLINRPQCNLEDIVTGNANNTDGSSTQCIAAQSSGIKTYLTSVILTNTSASMIYVEIKDGSTVKVTIPVPATGGAIFNPPVPIPGTAATAWNFDPSGATTTVYCSMIGFKSKV